MRSSAQRGICLKSSRASDVILGILIQVSIGAPDMLQILAERLRNLGGATIAGAALSGALFLQPANGAQTERDYILPPTEPGLVVLQKQVSPPQVALGPPAVVQYQAFDGSIYSLTEYPGRYVSLLLPASWIAAIDPAIRATLIDNLDLLYVHMFELIRAEPTGAGLLRVAVVPSTCGSGGCGWIARKGIEISETQLSSVLNLGGVPTSVFVHEMAHNYDLYWRQLGYLTDHAHAWTAYLQFAVLAYSREGEQLAHRSPQDVVSLRRSLFWDRYENNPAMTWATCVRDDSCPSLPLSPENIWAGRLHRLTELEGFSAIRSLFLALKGHRDASIVVSSPEEAEDLFWSSLASALGVDVTCYADHWRWALSASLRNELSSQRANPRCIDGDSDGYRPVDGDSDDFNSAVHPGASEIANGIDDNGDGLVDEVGVLESSVGDLNFFSPYAVSPPATLIGAVTSGSDQDAVSFSVSQFGGWRFSLRSAGPNSISASVQSAARWSSVSAQPHTESSMTVNLEPGASTLQIWGAGHYELSFGPGALWPFDCCTPLPPSASGQQVTLSGSVDPSSPFAGAPDQIRFWVEGTGFVGSAPFSGAPNFQLPLGGFDAGQRGFRLQPYSGGLPAAAPSVSGTIQVNSPCSAGFAAGPTLYLPNMASGASVAVNAPAGCPWLMTGGSEWLISQGDKAGSGPEQVTFVIHASPGSQDRSAQLRLGDQRLEVVQQGSSHTPRVTSSGWWSSGSSVTNWTWFWDPDGISDLGIVNVLVNSALDGRFACYTAFDAVSRTLYLVGDDGGSLTSGSIDGVGTLSNSQCSIDLGASTTQTSNGQLLLELVSTFNTSTFGGGRIVYGAARDSLGNNSGWRTLHVNQVPFATPPRPLPESVSPSSASGPRRTFAVTYRGPGGADRLLTMQVLVNRDLNGNAACYLGYDAPNNALYLIDDISPTLLGPIFPNSGSGFLENSQCRLYASGTSVSKLGSDVVLNIDLEFASVWRGETLLLFGGAQTSSGLNSGWQPLGTFRVTN